MTRLCRVLLDIEPQPGVRNMQIDEQLLNAAASRSEVFLRFYRWDQPTLSLGYFQQTEDDIPENLSRLPRVRRLSGGGAILHDQELTYSVAIPASHPLAVEPRRLYGAVHSAVIEVLQTAGLDCRLRGMDAGEESEDFLCFSRSDPHDLVISDRKVGGSAQRRRRGAVLQHGSLILKASVHTPAYHGLEDFGCAWSVEQLVEALITPMSRALEAIPTPASLEEIQPTLQ